MKNTKSFFIWTDEKWKNFLKKNFGPGKYYTGYSGGFYLSGYRISRKGKKLKIRKKLNGIILKLFLDYVN